MSHTDASAAASGPVFKKNEPIAGNTANGWTSTASRCHKDSGSSTVRTSESPNGTMTSMPKNTTLWISSVSRASEVVVGKSNSHTTEPTVALTLENLDSEVMNRCVVPLLPIQCAGDEINFNCDVISNESWIVLAAVVDAVFAAIQDHPRGVADRTYAVTRRVFDCARDVER